MIPHREVPKDKGNHLSQGKNHNLHRALLERENRSVSVRTLRLYRVPRRVRAALPTLNPGQRRAGKGGLTEPRFIPRRAGDRSAAGGTALNASLPPSLPIRHPPPPCELPPGLSLPQRHRPCQPAAPSRGRATHGLLPLIVRRSPLRSRTLEWSPAAAISRTCSTTLIPAAERRGAE